MNNIRSSLFDSDLCGLNPDSFQNSRIRDLSLCPKQANSPSDLKPPTLNSSFLVGPNTEPPIRQIASHKSSGTSRNQFDRVSQTINLIDGHQMIVDQESKNLISDNQRSSKKLFGMFKDDQFEKITSLKRTETNYRQAIQQRFVKRFYQNLLQKTYVYRERYYNEQAKSYMLEEYVKNPNDGNIFTNEESIKIKRILLDYIFDSQHICNYIWNIILIIAIILSYCWISYRLGFQEDSLSILENIILAVLIVDIFLQSNKSFIVMEKIIKNRKQILINYFKQYFIIDALTLGSYIILHIMELDLLLTLLLQFVYYILGYLKIRRNLNELLENVYLEKQMLSISRFINLTIVIIVFSHIIACNWHLVGIHNREESWIIDQGLADSNNASRYWQSINWSMSILTNVGNNNSHNHRTIEENIFTAAIMLISTIIFGLIIYTLFQYLNYVDKSNYQNNKVINNINKYMSKNNIPFSMRSRVKNYLKYYSSQDNKTNLDESSSFISNLPELLKQELLLSIRGQAINRCKALHRFSKSTIDQIIQSVETVRFSPNDQIIQKSKLDDRSLYLIQSGQVEIYDKNDKYTKTYATLKEGDSFGEWTFFTGQDRLASAKALGFVRLFKIPQQQFMRILKSNKIDNEIYILIRYQLLFYNQFNYANMQCYSCDSQNHLIQKCPQLHYLCDLERQIKIDTYNIQTREDFLRSGRLRVKAQNQTFIMLQNNKEALRFYRQKHDMDQDDIDADEICSESQDLSESSEDISSLEKYSEKLDQRDGTFDSMLKVQDKIKEQSNILHEVDQDESGEQMFIIRPNEPHGTVGTAQFQLNSQLKDSNSQQLVIYQQQQQIQMHQSQFIIQQQLSQQYQQTSPLSPKRKQSDQPPSNLSNFKLTPNNNGQLNDTKMKRTSSSLQLNEISSQPVSSQLIANEGHVPSVKKLKNQHLTFKSSEMDSSSGGNISGQRGGRTYKSGSSNKLSIANISDKTKKNLSKIREEDSDTLNLSNRKSYDEFQSNNVSPSVRKISTNSKNGQVRQSMKHFSSKLSSIPLRSGTITKSIGFPYQRTNIKQLTNAMVDLSMFRRDEESNEEFERMQQFQYFYPINNYDRVIARVNRFIFNERLMSTPSKYTFYYYVKILADKLRRNLPITISKEQ